MMDAHAARTLSKKRTTNFGEVETKLLIQLWGSPQIQNKLYLTHRKAPVMRLLAANMQQRGFFRTPDEIKTRIRNLKCLYHRIKRSMHCGTGLGTVDPDWPHYKAMDDILTKKNLKKDIYDNVFEGPRCEDIKQEIDDIDINDDMESYATNSFGESDYEDETMQMPPLTPAPKEPTKELPKELPALTIIKEAKEPKQKEPEPPVPTSNNKLPKILPNLHIPVQSGATSNNIGIRTTPQGPTIPFPLLILNGLPNQSLANQASIQDKKDQNASQKSIFTHAPNFEEVNATLKSLLTVQKESLEVEKQRLELEKQKLDFERLIGTQLLGLLPMFGSILQSVTRNAEDSLQNGKKRNAVDAGFDIIKASKILRTDFEETLKKYVCTNKEGKSDSENEESDDSRESK